MVRWYYAAGFGIAESNITNGMDLTGLGKYTEIEDSEWYNLSTSISDEQIIINNPKNNHPMLYRDSTIVLEKQKATLRQQRETECFPIINRGYLWYEKFVDTVAKKEELEAWYDAWLNVTDTLTVPTAPSWLGGEA